MRRNWDSSSLLPDPPVRKPNPLVRIGIGTAIGLGLAGLIVFAAKTSQSPSPDERATALTLKVAPDAVRVITTGDAPSNARIKAVVAAMETESNCTFVAGTITTGNTRAIAAAAAEKLIAAARVQLGDTADEYGMGYTVVPGLVRDTVAGEKRPVPDKFVAVLAAIRCVTEVTPSVPGFRG